MSRAWLQGVPLVCAACSLLLCFGCSVFEVSHGQRLSLPEVGSVLSGQCFVLGQNVASFNKVRSGLLVK